MFQFLTIFNSNQQQRFIILIDILYEKKINLMISLVTDLDNIGSSKMLEKPFKRTVSRLFELTSLIKNFLIRLFNYIYIYIIKLRPTYSSTKIIKCCIKSY